MYSTAHIPPRPCGPRWHAARLLFKAGYQSDAPPPGFLKRSLHAAWAVHWTRTVDPPAPCMTVITSPSWMPCRAWESQPPCPPPERRNWNNRIWHPLHSSWLYVKRSLSRPKNPRVYTLWYPTKGAQKVSEQKELGRKYRGNFSSLSFKNLWTIRRVCWPQPTLLDSTDCWYNIFRYNFFASWDNAINEHTPKVFRGLFLLNFDSVFKHHVLIE